MLNTCLIENYKSTKVREKVKTNKRKNEKGKQLVNQTNKTLSHVSKDVETFD